VRTAKLENKNRLVYRGIDRRDPEWAQSTDRIDRDFTIEVKDQSGDIVTEVRKTIHVRKKQANWRRREGLLTLRLQIDPDCHFANIGCAHGSSPFMAALAMW